MADGFTMTWRVLESRWGQIIPGMEQAAGRLVRKTALDVERIAKTSAPIDTGTLRNSIRAAKVAPFHYRVTVGVDYGVYVEWGTSRMAAQPFIRPAVAQVRPEFLAALRELVTP